MHWPGLLLLKSIPGMRQRQIVQNARKLVGMLPDRALAKMSVGWIRRSPDNAAVIEFFWSLSFNMLNPGNKMTTIGALGGGEFSVELRTSAERFNAGKWQRGGDGEPKPGVLSLATDGAQSLVDELMNWQVGKVQ